LDKVEHDENLVRCYLSKDFRRLKTTF